ncbi:hypothetical protein HG530_002853 [Fusarium avenaceum]|nr:hypothetical protein HG530_002853 [Fusarium avenaceum]
MPPIQSYSLRCGASNPLETVDFLEDLLGFLTFDPFLVPINLGTIRSSVRSSSGLEDELGNILVGRADSTAVREVFDNILLVNGADDGLTSSAQLSEETNNRVSRLRVKTRGRLVEEEKQRWLGCQLDTNGQPLTLLYTKTHNDGVLQVIELKKVNDLVHIRNLLSTGNRGILSQDSRKLNGLSYGLGCIMKITLKAESSIPLEVCT